LIGTVLAVKRQWVYDALIEKGLLHARAHHLDLGTGIGLVAVRDLETYHVIPPEGMIDSIRKAAAKGLPWPKRMPLPVVACAGLDCLILDGHHRIEAARRLGLQEVPAVIASLSAWESLLPVIEQPDVIPYDDFIAILAEAGSEEIRDNLKLERQARPQFGS